MQNKKSIKNASLLAVGLWLPMVHGGGIDVEVVETPTWNWLVEIDTGALWVNADETHTLYLAPQLEKAYVPHDSTETLWQGELFLGAQKLLGNGWIGQAGVAVATTSQVKINGEIWDDADPAFNNAVYHYKINHNRLALKGKLLVDKGYGIMPWISGSVGVGWNQSHDFKNQPIIFEALPTPNFSSHNETSFIYTVGAGIQAHVHPHWQVGLGYEFADWGRSELGRAAGQTYSKKLGLDHFYTHGVLLNLTYLL